MNANRIDPQEPSATDWRHAPAVQEQVEQLLGRMSIEEKADLVTGDLNFNYGFYNAPIERLGIPPLQMADGPAGVRIGDGRVHDARATALPAPILLGATWDVNLARRYGDVLGAEARASGHNVLLGPAVDIARSPFGGRTFESFGEDPLLNARMAAAEIEALQAHAVLASLKHFVANNQEHARFSVNVQVSERALRELYLRPFENVVRSTGIATLMGAFNKVNGSHACEHQRLLGDVLRGEWGFRGWVMSDYGATHSTLASAMAGLDQEHPQADFYGAKLVDAVRSGALPAETLDEMARRILRTLVGLGLMERPPAVGPMATAEHAAVAREIAEQGVVLLKNAGALLPLAAEGIGAVAVIGADADNVGAAGGGSGKVNPCGGVSLLDGIRRRLGPAVRVEHAPGTDCVTAAALLPGSTPIPSSFFTPAEGEGTGLLAQYWANAEMHGEPRLTRVDPGVGLNLGFFNYPGFGASSPHAPHTPDELTGRIAVRWQGWLEVPVSGPYDLEVVLLGSVRLELDGAVLIDHRFHGWGPINPTQPDAAADVAPQPADTPLLLGGSGGSTSAPRPEFIDVPIKLQAGRRYRVDLRYAADAPCQVRQVGAQVRLNWRPPAGVVDPRIAAAVELARAADVAVVAVRDYESEQMDRPSLRLPNGQDALIRAVAAANPRTVVITMTGAPVETASWEGGVAALLHAWYPGQEQGDALARLLFGDVSPSGRLPLSFPRGDGETLHRGPAEYPGIHDTVRYAEGIHVGYRGEGRRGPAPHYPFGHGLTYTSFSYADLVVSRQPGSGVVEVACQVTNSGGRAGAEVVQVYIGLPPATGAPAKQLVDWAKVQLAPGASQQLRFVLDPASIERPFSWWDEATGGWRVAEGACRIMVGASSADIRLAGSVD